MIDLPTCRKPQNLVTGDEHRVQDRQCQRSPAVKFKDAVVRVVKIDREPWFVATDVAAALALSLYADGSPNVTATTRGIDASEKQLLRRSTPHLMLGSVERLITESDLNKLVMGRGNDPRTSSCLGRW